MKVPAILIAFLVFGPFFFAVQDEPTPENSPDRCDLAGLEESEYCHNCEVVEPDLDKEGYCIECGAPPSWVSVCVKEYYICEKCGSRRAEDRKCCHGAEIRMVVVKASTLYLCEKCGVGGDYETPCENLECLKAGAKIRLTCKKSGTWPHGGKPPR